MTKTRTQWVCQSCGRTTPREMGRCPGCGEWGTLIEVIEQPVAATPAGMSAFPASEPRRLSEIGSEGLERLPLPLAEFSRVLGGGVVPGSLILVGGDPGIGKSTLLTQTAGLMALGVDAARSALIVLAGSQMAVSDTAHLAQLVKRFVQGEAEKGKEATMAR